MKSQFQKKILIHLLLVSYDGVIWALRRDISVGLKAIKHHLFLISSAHTIPLYAAKNSNGLS